MKQTSKRETDPNAENRLVVAVRGGGRMSEIIGEGEKN